MHLYAFKHKVHSVDTLHSDALAFLRIQAHEDAFTHTSSQGECRPPKGLAQLQDSCMLTRVCILTHSYAYVCIHMYSNAFVYIRLHSFAFSCLQLVQEDPAQLGNLRGVLAMLILAICLVVLEQHVDLLECVRMHTRVSMHESWS